VKTTYIGSFNRPDGYTGSVGVAHFVADGGDIYAVYPFGYCTVCTRVDKARTVNWILSHYWI
jgi:hypothetical protein